jgi:hypothetical protein
VEIGRSIFYVTRNLHIRSLHAPRFFDTLVCAAITFGASAAERPPTGHGTARYAQTENGENRDEKASHIRDSERLPAKVGRTYSDYRHGEQRRLSGPAQIPCQKAANPTSCMWFVKYIIPADFDALAASHNIWPEHEFRRAIA